ncbi:mannosyl-3-phosphoglycerate phosphatase [Candidatus Scalindua japonica]|uniref:Mannosyl-3-phosphoglycerate phosphatase n=1 Tax=Candidatus Scalindua japonica TaxID=1284222 RepID=A0A286TZ49_9BACT|nr:HAD-IIB family hydrolase [Candidatus Scalindua japonica]GAX61144.1 mannosyl-3-phosphoglycerate phosphatase [Candidatus Scalindua japonica]
MSNEIIIVFTDLDGTLLDHSTYSYSEAENALRSLREKGIHLVLCSSKSRDEIKIYRDKLSNNEPFISENGGAIYIPEKYGLKCEFNKTDNGFLVVEIGAEYEILKTAFDKIKRETGVQLKGIAEFTVDEIVDLTGLSREEACFAQKKEYSLPFLIDGSEEDIEKIKNKIQLSGFNYTEGARFAYMMGGNDKGKAVSFLIDIFRKNYTETEILTVGLGDSLNDLPMLEAVDKKFLVKKKLGNYEERIKVKDLNYADGIGPVGWNKAILGLFGK